MCARGSSSCSYRWIRSKQIWSGRREPRSLWSFFGGNMFARAPLALPKSVIRRAKSSRSGASLAHGGNRLVRCLPSAWPAHVVSLSKSTAPTHAGSAQPGTTGESQPTLRRASFGRIAQAATTSVARCFCTRAMASCPRSSRLQHSRPPPTAAGRIARPGTVRSTDRYS